MASCTATPTSAHGGKKGNGIRNETKVLKLGCASKPEGNQKVMASVQDVNLEFNRAQLKITIGK